MTENYAHKGKPLNTPIIKDILGCSIRLVNKLPQTSEWLSVNDILDRITQYHLQNGGKPNLRSLIRTSVIPSVNWKDGEGLKSVL